MNRPVKAQHSACNVLPRNRPGSFRHPHNGRDHLAQAPDPNTEIIGWGTERPSAQLDHPPYPTPIVSPLLSLDGPSVISGALARVAGTVGSLVETGTGHDVDLDRDSIRPVGTHRRADRSIWRDLGSCVEYSVEREWLDRAGFLFAIQPWDASPTAVAVSPIAVMTPNVVMSERPYLAEMHAGVGATVTQEIRIWSMPGPDMQVVWTAETSDHFTVTGEPISYNNADWAPTAMTPPVKKDGSRPSPTPATSLSTTG